MEQNSSSDITYCNNRDCDILSCSRNPKHIKYPFLPHSFAHLEGNPTFCKKSNWYGYQSKEENIKNV